jgi:hypothetical protein
MLRTPKRENERSRRTQVQFAVGFRVQGKSGHVVVDAEDALIAALKVKAERPEAQGNRVKMCVTKD